MSRWGNEEYLRDFDDWRIKHTREWVEQNGFWAFVDSQSTAYTHSGPCEVKPQFGTGQRVDCSDWTHVRGEGCVAARSDLTQCRQEPLSGLPFCPGHFDKAWRAILSWVVGARSEVADAMADFDYRSELRDHQMDVAMVRDARRQLLLSAERVYFFAAGDFVKIGRSINPEKRVKTLGATKAPDEVDLTAGELLGTIPGGCFVESMLHLRFRPHRVIGEWFLLEPIRESVLGLIEEHAEERAA